MMTSPGAAELDLEKWQKTVDLLAELYGADAASVVKLDGDSFRVWCTSEQENRLDSEGTSFPSDMKTHCRAVLEADGLHYVKCSDEDPQWCDAPPRKLGVNSYLGFPVKRPDGSFFGTICVKNSTATDYSDAFVKMLAQFRDLMEADLTVADYTRQIECMARTDSATGLANRRGLAHYLDNAEGRGGSYSLLYFDLDNLKRTNDSYGHRAGDLAITLLSETFQAQMRTGDIAARVGGDEFVLIVRVKEADEANQLCARLAAEYANKCKAHVELSLVGVSYGAMFVPDAEDPLTLDELLSHADTLMYAHKRHRKGGGP